MTLAEAGRALREGRVSSVELVRTALERIERLNPSLNAFLTVLPEYALERAGRADRELAAGGARGPLHGIPLAVKDLIDMQGVRTTGGARIYEDTPAAADAAVIEKLDAAGAVIVGKLNLHELAYGITSENPHFGPVRNPWNWEHSAGGSSGGSGAAVAAGMVLATLGTDTGGSIRVPAAFCGTVGFKPTYGLVSRHRVQPLGFSLDHVGPLARSVRDAAEVLQAIAGYDSRDPASRRFPGVNYVPAGDCSIKDLRIGLSEDTLGERVDAEVAGAVREAAARAVSLGALVKPIVLPDLEAVNTVGQVLLLAEAAAVFEPYRAHRERFGADVLALLDQGRLLAATDYLNAQRLRRQFQMEFARIWSEVDCLVTPAVPIAAPRLGEATLRPLVTRFSRPFNVLGVPAIALPCGLTTARLPVSLQIVGPPFGDALVLRVAAALEDSGVTIPAAST